MAVILDTNALSAWAEGDATLLTALPNDRSWILPVVVLGEFRYGIRRLRERSTLERWLGDIQSACVIAMIDLETADFYAILRDELRVKGTPIPENDIWIAALCRQHHAPIATRDAHFDHVRGLRRIAW